MTPRHGKRDHDGPIGPLRGGPDDDEETDRYILDEHGSPVRCPNLITWALWMETAERRISQDIDESPNGPKVRVSTVFLGLDYRFGEGPPLLWETMVFGGPLDQEMDRYSSLEAAMRGHQKMCERVNAALMPLKGTDDDK